MLHARSSRCRRPLLIVEAKTRAKFWAQLKRLDPTAAFGPGDDVMVGYKPGESLSLPTAADIPAVWAASTGSRVGNPPVVMEPPPRWLNLSDGIEVDRYSVNALVDYYRQQMPGATFVGVPPRMWVSGDLPPVTGSGIPQRCCAGFPGGHATKPHSPLAADVS